MKGCILIAITFCLYACRKEQVDPVDNTVHLAGFLAMPTGSSGATSAVASYWKNGDCTVLTNELIPNTESTARVTSLYVDGSSVFMGGWKWVENSMPRAVYWQDGKETVIDGAFGTPTLIALRNNNLFGVWTEGPTGWVFNKNGTSQPIIDTASSIGPTGLAILGGDMYISGASYYHDWTSPNSTIDAQHAQCWKNGQLIFRESENSNARSIFIHQRDIYMAGHIHDNEPPKSIACYWKNGQRVNLTDGSVPALAKSVFVTDTHVYAAGMIDGQAVYWKDGSVIPLTTEGTYSMANSIFVQATDVHVGGYEHGHPAYWKNDVRQTISNQDKFGQIEFVVVGSN